MSLCLESLVKDNTLEEVELIEKTSNDNIVQFENNNKKTEENIEETDDSPKASLSMDIISLKDWINKNIDNIKYVENIDIPIDNEDIMLLKSIEVEGENSEKYEENVQLYKDVSNYMIFDCECDFMKLYGENGFMIQSKPINNYCMRLYGNKSTVYITIYLIMNDILYPIYHMKSQKNKLTTTVFDNLLSEKDVQRHIDTTDNFDLESCIIIYKPLHKVIDTVNTKNDVLKWLAETHHKIFDVSHAVKIDNRMYSILNM